MNLEREQGPFPAGSSRQSVGFSLYPWSNGEQWWLKLGAGGLAGGVGVGIQICISRISFNLLHKKWTKEGQNSIRESREEAAAVVWAQDNGDLGGSREQQGYGEEARLQTH